MIRCVVSKMFGEPLWQVCVYVFGFFMYGEDGIATKDEAVSIGREKVAKLQEQARQEPEFIVYDGSDT